MKNKFFLIIFFIFIFSSKCQYSNPFLNYRKRSNQNKALTRTRQKPIKPFPKPQRNRQKTLNIREKGRFQKNIEPLIGKPQFQTLFQQFQSGLSINNFVMNIIEILRYQNTHLFPDNYAKNTIAFKNHISTIKANNGFIEDQHKYIDMTYGKKRLSENGCGLIAVYNVIYFLTKNENIDFPAIVKALEYDGIILSGLFGTSSKAIDDYLKRQGFKTKSSSKMSEYDYIGNYFDAFVLTILNNKNDIAAGMHFVAITKENGGYTVHNNGYQSTSVTYTSIRDILTRINSGKAKDIYLTGVKI